MTENRENLLVVDGMALLFRAFYATAVSKQFMLTNRGYRRMGCKVLCATCLQRFARVTQRIH